MATLVLVHGTTAGGWVWKQIASRLREAGHEVYTPTLTGLGERVHLLTHEVGLDMHITDIVNVLRYEELREVILVGLSYSGMVITGVADKIPERIAKLIYLDALVPKDGESVLDLAGLKVREDIYQRVQTEGEGWLIPVMRGPNDIPAPNAPHPYKTWLDPIALTNEARRQIPCVYVRFTADKQPGELFQMALEMSWQRARARTWQIEEVDTVHQVLPDPESKATVLLKLAADAT